MNAMRNILGLTLTGLLFASSVSAQKTGVEQFAPIMGYWQGEVDGAQLTERWKRVDDHHMVGEGYVVAGPDTVVREVLRIQRIGAYWTYIPVINDGHPVLFTLIEAKKDKWVFENKEHDFPQRVIYTIQKDGSLLAWIEGEQEGEFVKEEYRMKRSK